MPIYEYVCDACGHGFESLVSPGRESEVSCPACGAPRPRKRISCFGIGGGSSRIKGSTAGCTSCSSKSCGTCH